MTKMTIFRNLIVYVMNGIMSMTVIRLKIMEQISKIFSFYDKFGTAAKSINNILRK